MFGNSTLASFFSSGGCRLHLSSVHVTMFDTALSKCHCCMRSLSDDVLFEEVCAVGFSSVKSRLCTEVYVNMKDTHESTYCE